MRTIAIAVLLIFTLFLFFSCRTIQRTTDSKPVKHEIWDSLLKKHVSESGYVDYSGFQKDSSRLNKYLKLLSSAHPNEKNWTRNERMAYWINAYNAFTIQLMVRHYPVESIKDIKSGIPYINSVWDIKFITIEGFEYDLNNIEHNILRPVFEDARIHFAINCASYSCPKLRREAYTADKLEEQLDDAAVKFVNDPVRNEITKDKVEVSSIFDGFKGDFKRDAGTLREYLNRYAEVKIPEGKDIDFKKYNWTINDISKE